jgi:hypothetical protein
MDKADLSYTILLYGFLTVIVLGYTIVFALALYVRDVEVIKRHPFKFTLETLLIGAGLSLPFYYYGYWRNLPWKERHLIVLGLFVKFVSLHILLQIAGFYSGLHNDYNRPQY